MQALSDTRLVALWERGQRRSTVIRGLLLAVESEEIGERDPAQLSIGERDAAILRLHARRFGPRLQGYTDCPSCGERLEFDFDCAKLLQELSSPQGSEFTAGDLRFRLPNSSDLIAIANTNNVVAAERSLLRRCCLDAADVTEWTDALVAQFEERIGALDPAADIRFGFTCAACTDTWNERFDIVAWCWDEIELRARRLFDEVHELARAYSWSEVQILALGEARRRAYLERCEA